MVVPPLRTKRVFSGIQPTGQLHLGNYIGALSLWVAHQAEYESIFCIVDLHALSSPEAVPRGALAGKVRELVALFLASGIDPARAAVFVQSHVPAHAELAWLLNCVTPLGWLQRMTQYKAKAARRARVSAALLDYPVLQAADILLYDTDLVPVGEDQKQHVELTRDIAQRFHRLFGETFVLPEAVSRPNGARIMGLDDPAIKMSKSVTKRWHAIGLTDSPAVIRAAIARAVTDSDTAVRVERASPGVRNLLTIHEALSGESAATTAERFAGKGYEVLKRAVTDVVIATLAPIRARYQELMADPAYLDRLLAAGAERVQPIAAVTLERARQQIGLPPRAGAGR